jgi:flagellar biosynthesis/type III secretory pathway protein FliH
MSNFFEGKPKITSPLEEKQPVFDHQLFNDVADAIHQLERGKYSMSEDDELPTEDQREQNYQLILNNKNIFKQALSSRLDAHPALFRLRCLYNIWESNKEDGEDGYQNRYAALGREMIQDLQPDLERALQEGWVDGNDVLNAYYDLAQQGNTEQKAIGLQGLGKHLDIIRKKLDNENEQAALSYVKEVLLRGSPMDQGSASSLIRDVLEKRPNTNHAASLVSAYFDSEDDFFRQLGEKHIESMCQRQNLPYREIYKAWRQSTTPLDERPLYLAKESIKSFSMVVYDNLKRLQELEKQSPEAARWLYDNWSIADFGRYPADVLAEQYQQRDNRTVPYGVVIMPRSDWNGAFYSTDYPLGELHTQVKGEFLLRIAECETKIDVVRMLRKFNSLYSPEDASGQKISLLILGGHGSETSIRFGGKDKKHILLIEDLDRTLADEPRGYFEDEPTFILASCSTGAKEAIGQKLSQKYGAKLIAPDVPTAPYKFVANRRRGGKWRFNAFYREDEAKKIFKQGTEI